MRWKPRWGTSPGQNSASIACPRRYGGRVNPIYEQMATSVFERMKKATRFRVDQGDADRHG